MAGLVPFNRKNREIAPGGFKDFYNMMDDFFTPRSFERATFRVDVHDTEKEYIVEAELPGTEKGQIGLSMDEGRLTISVNKDETVENKEKHYPHKERRFTSMSRAVHLQEANPEGIRAKLENGVLTVTVPKLEKPEDTQKKIEID